MAVYIGGGDGSGDWSWSRGGRRGLLADRVLFFLVFEAGKSHLGCIDLWQAVFFRLNGIDCDGEAFVRWRGASSIGREMVVMKRL